MPSVKKYLVFNSELNIAPRTRRTQSASRGTQYFLLTLKFSYSVSIGQTWMVFLWHRIKLLHFLSLENKHEKKREKALLEFLWWSNLQLRPRNHSLPYHYLIYHISLFEPGLFSKTFAVNLFLIPSCLSRRSNLFLLSVVLYHRLNSDH